MHELSIAANIISIAKGELSKANGQKLEKIHLQVGSLSGIEIESLLFALKSSHGVLEDTEIKIEEMPGKLRCLECGVEFESADLYTLCPQCRQFKLEVVVGKELIIKSMTIS
ncbi:MAG: hydrogenase maturation nickel metallochaperone HypA [Cyclobacteriaceae bacterium]|nr:hydrogenase maturation nickel metallochaperone HypA [Cyclobacteriaceae bacterium]